MFNWNKKEKPFLGFGGFGGGGLGLAGGAAAGGIDASGGQQDGVEPGNGYKYHTFTTTGAATFTVNNAPGDATVEVLLLGGGGRGSTGGGGAGALIYKNSVPITAQAYPLVIGTGGQPFDAPFSGPAGPYPAGLGVPSTAFGYTSAGGGHGGVHNQNGTAGAPGGSGGGGAPRNGGGPGSPGPATGASGGSAGAVSPDSGWGNAGNGSTRNNPGSYGGGGGGAGGAGQGGNPGGPGGGLAYPDFAGPLVGVPSLPGVYGAGGSKNGQSGDLQFPAASQAIANTGNGGGNNEPGVADSTLNGSSGVVIIRYLV